MTDNMSFIRKTANLFRKEYIVCHKDPNDLMHWDCETGYKTLEETSKRIDQLKSSQNTIILTTHHGTPDSVRQRITKQQLTPSIGLCKKPE
jgi:hypothetical protein